MRCVTQTDSKMNGPVRTMGIHTEIKTSDASMVFWAREASFGQLGDPHIVFPNIQEWVQRVPRIR